MQAEADFQADPSRGVAAPSAFVTCATQLTEGGQSATHADDTRALMTAVLLGGISQDDLTVSRPLCLANPEKLQSYPLGNSQQNLVRTAGAH